MLRHNYRRYFLGYSLSSALTLVSLTATWASADLYPGDCGKAGSSSGSNLSSSDALAILKGSVGTADCVPFICDMNNDGSVLAGDALTALRTAVGTLTYSDVDNCPTTCPSDVCTCTAATLIQRLKDLGTKNAGEGQRLASGVGALLRCPPSTTISLTDSNGATNTDSWDDADTDIEQNSLWISALGATNSKNVTLELGPTCDQRCLGQCQCTTNSNCASGKSCSGGLCTCATNADCPGSSCASGLCVGKDCTQDEECTGAFSGSLLCKGTGGRAAVADPISCSSGCTSVGTNTCSDGHYKSKSSFVGGACPNVDAGQRFLKLSGDYLTVAGLTIRGFFDGIHMGGEDGTVRDCILQRQCDDSITNVENEGRGSIVQDTTIKEHCDKGTQDYAGPAISGSCSGRSCWHIAYQTVMFQGCKLPLRATDDGTYIKVSNATISSLGTGTSNADYWCQESKLDGADVVSLLEDSVVDSCESSMVYGGARSQHDVEDSLITDASQRGLDARGAGSGADIGATLSLVRSKVVGNGGDNGSAPLGGLTISSEGFMMIGDGTSTNANKICGNVKGDGSRRQVNDIRSGGSQIVATQNYWGQSTGPVQQTADPLFCTSSTNCDVVGNIDYDPYRTTDPFSTTACE